MNKVLKIAAVCGAFINTAFAACMLAYMGFNYVAAVCTFFGAVIFVYIVVWPAILAAPGDDVYYYIKPEDL